MCKRVQFLCLIFSIVLVTAIPPTTSTAEEAPRWLRNDTLVVARVGDSTSYAAYSKHSGKWMTHTFPKSISAVPVTGTSLIAFALEGEGITEIVAVDRNGKWRPHKLTGAASERCIPVIGTNVAAYHIGDRAYAFSGLTGSWDSTASTSPVQVDDDLAMIVASDRIAMFSAETGTWAESPVLKSSE